MHYLYTTISNFEIVQFKNKEWMDRQKFHKIIGVAEGDASRK